VQQTGWAELKKYVYQIFGQCKPIPSLPAVTGEANNRDGAAVKPNLPSEGTEDDPQQSREQAHDGVAGLLDAVTALDRSSVALATRRGISGSSCSDGCEGEDSGGDLELHV
jgi:hypothetical protein